MDLFTQPPTIEDARTARDIVLQRVEKSSGEVFNERARAFVLQFLREKGPHSGEDITDAAKASGITPPKDDRQFGPVLMRLSRAGLIEKNGTGDRRKGHGSSGATVWKIADNA